MKLFLLLMTISFVSFADIQVIHSSPNGFMVEVQSTEMLQTMFIVQATVVSYDDNSWYITRRDKPTIVLPKTRYFCDPVSHGYFNNKKTGGNDGD